MTTLVTRADKGSPLTNNEMDANLINLNTDKLETSTAAATYFTITDAALKIDKTSNTGAALIPAGTTAERPVTPQYGATRANSTLNQQEWWNGTDWVPMGGGVPTGTVIFTASSSAPTGFIKANGALVSRTTYAALFAVIGTTFGNGDGATTFNIPDLRGEFIRGWDDGRGVDSGRVFGSYQGDSLKSHTHTYVKPVLSTNPLDHDSSLDADRSVTTTTEPTSATGDTETRPRNIALLACIKF